MKAYVEDVLRRAGVNRFELEIKPADDDIFAQAMEFVTRGGKRLAVFGSVNYTLLKSFDIAGDVFFADINWKVLMSTVRKLKISYTDLPKFPAVRRDLALLLDHSTTFAEVEKIAYETERKYLKEVKLFDVYEGKGLEPGKKSYAVYFILQDENQTLNDKMIDKIMWSFDHQLEVGERIVFEDMIHYTTVKTNMFNGIQHPAIGLWTSEGKAVVYKEFGYADYRDRMC